MAAGVTNKLWEMSDMVKVLEDWEGGSPHEQRALLRRQGSRMSSQRLIELVAAFVVCFVLILIFERFQKCGWDYAVCHLTMRGIR